MKTQKGETWNESQTHADPVAGRTVRRITTKGDINEKPTYHTNTTFSDDGEFMIFGSNRDGQAAIFRAHLPTGDITQLTDPVESQGSMGGGGCLARTKGWAVYWQGSELRAVHMHTLEERTLVDFGPQLAGGCISIDASESHVVVPVGPAHPDVLAGKPNSEIRNFKEVFADGVGLYMKLMQVPLDGGEAKEVYHFDGAKCAHSPRSPTDDDLILIDRDLPPMFWSGGDMSKTPRCRILRFSTGEVTPLWPTAESKFQIHSAWSWDGQFILYHGPAVLVEGPCPWYIGVVRPNGELLREWTFAAGKHYGHVAAAGGDRPAIVIDGNLSPNLLQWLYYDSDQPRFEVICEHNTELNSIPGQASHPHPSTDRRGRWVAFNVARAGRTDVCVVEV